MDKKKNLTISEFDSLPKKSKHTYLYNLLDFNQNKTTMNPFIQSEKDKISIDSSKFNNHQITDEYYDDEDNLNHYDVNRSEERELDTVEIIRSPISETNPVFRKNPEPNTTLDNSQYQAKTVTYPSQLITSQMPELFQDQRDGMKSTIMQSTTPRRFQSFDDHQNLDGNVPNPQIPLLSQLTEGESSKTQYNDLGDIKFSGNYSVTQPQQEPLILTQNEGFQGDCLIHPSQAKIVPIPYLACDRWITSSPEDTPLLFNGLQDAQNRKMGYVQAVSEEDRDSDKIPSEELEVPTVDLDVFLKQEGRFDYLNSKEFELSADHFEGDNGKDQDFEHEILRDNIGHLESNSSAESSGDINVVSLNHELGISSGANFANFADSVLFSILGSLEEGGEKVPSNYNGMFDSFQIPTIEDPLAMIGHGPTAAGTPETIQEGAGQSIHGDLDSGVYGHGDYDANESWNPMAEAVDSSERQHNQLLPTEGYGLAARDCVLPNNEAEGYSSLTRDQYSLPAGGYGAPANNNYPLNYMAQRDVFGGLNAGHCQPPEYAAMGTADTNCNSDILDQMYFSQEQCKAPVTMKSYPVTMNRELNYEAHPSSSDNAQFGRPVAPLVQPRIQMSRSDLNPESDSILPSIEFNVVDENNSAERLNELPENQANPVRYGTSLNMNVPGSLSQYAKSLGNEIEAEFKEALANKQIKEDPNRPILIFDPSSVNIAENTFVNRCARECNDTLETEWNLAMNGQVIDNNTLTQVPIPNPPRPNNRTFYFGGCRRARKDNRPRRPSLSSVRSPKEYSPPRETGPEIPEYDFHNIEVPILPPDFNTAQEIKRRLVAKYAISKKPMRCRGCGYMGHVCSWAGCPALICERCHQEGHGIGFCPHAHINDRWRNRSGKANATRQNMSRMTRMMNKEMEIRLGRQKVRQRNQNTERGLDAFGDQNTRGYPQETPSPRSLLTNRQWIADQSRAWNNEEENNMDMGLLRAPEAQMIATGPTANISSFGYSPSMVTDHWPRTEWQPFENTQVNTHGQETLVPADMMTNKQGYDSNPEVEHEQYAEYRLDGQGQWFPCESGAESAKAAEFSEFVDDIETTEPEIQDTEGEYCCDYVLAGV